MLVFMLDAFSMFNACRFVFQLGIIDSFLCVHSLLLIFSLHLFTIVVYFLFFFFFSSRRRHTRSLCDWSSDVCSSDLVDIGLGERIAERVMPRLAHAELAVLVGVAVVEAVVVGIDRRRRVADRELEQIGRASCRERV